MRHLVRYGAVGLAAGLTVSLVVASWVFSGSFARAKSVRLAAPQVIAEVLRLREDLAASFDQYGPRFAERPNTAEQLMARLSDTSAGLAAMRESLGIGGGRALEAVREALDAEAVLLQALSSLLGHDPFDISGDLIEEVVVKASDSNVRLASAMALVGVRATGASPERWLPNDALSEMTATSGRLRDASRSTELTVVGRTSSSVTFVWEADDIADWSGMWLSVDGAEPVLVTAPTYTISGVEPLATVRVAVSLALGESGRFRGPAVAFSLQR